jgi:hypothetical protein
MLLGPRLTAAQLLGGHEFQVAEQTLGSQHMPAVVADGAGNTTIFWWDANACLGQRYDASGASIGSAVDIAYCDFYDPEGKVAADAAGNIVGLLNGVTARRFSSSLAPIGSEIQVSTGSRDVNAEVAVRPSGEFVVVWNTFYSSTVQGRSFDSSGTANGPPFDIGFGHLPSVAYDDTGNFLVVWFDFTFDIVGRGFDSAGTPLGPEFSLPLGFSNFVVTAAAAGEFIVAALHPAVGGLRGLRIDLSGTALGPPFPIVDDTYDGQFVLHRPVVDGAGNVLFTWTAEVPANGREMYGRLFDVTGSPQGSSFPINIYQPGHQYEGVAAGTAGTGFVVAWTSSPETGRGQDGDGAGVFARRLDDAIGIDGRRVLIKDAPAATNRRIVFRAGDTVVSTRSGDGMNPVTDGAYLHVYGAGGSADSACLPLPAIGWVASGDPEHPTYDYKDTTFANGPCKRVRLKHGGVLQASCSASVQPIPYSLDEASQGSVAVRFVSGGLSYCTTFGGTVAKDAQGSAFVARNASAPVPCAVPPASCP